MLSVDVVDELVDDDEVVVVIDDVVVDASPSR